MSFFEELKRRNVIRVGIAYVVIAWLIAQVADLALGNFEAPGWVIKTVLLVLALGLPVAVFFAWAFELTPEGIKKEKDVDRNQSITRQTRRKLDFLIIGVLILTLAYFVVSHDWQGGSGDAAAPAAEAGPKSVAVLPFVNLSSNDENAFFASGVHEDILTHLARVADLRVISRTSVLKYANNTERNLKSIAAELGVNHVVEGSVRRAGNKVRVTAQLVDATTDEHIWADNYDRDLTDVFEIQTAVAQEIVAALKANLTPQEQQAIASRPTDSIDAYDLYLKAREIDRDLYFGAEKASGMAPLLEQALAHDPNFALAHAKLASTQLVFYWTTDKSQERLEQARAAIDRAFELQPNLPEARAALAEYYYRGFRDYERGLAEIERAHDLYPNSTEILVLMAYLQRRLGRWDETIDTLQGIEQLDPGNLSAKKDIADTFVGAHRWQDAARYCERMMAQFPQEDFFKRKRAEVALALNGDVALARRYLDELSNNEDATNLIALARVYSLTGDYELALRQLERLKALADPLVHAGVWRQAFSWSSLAARVQLQKNNRDAAIEHAEAAIEMLEAFARSRDPVGPDIMAFLAQDYAIVGRVAEARQFATDVLENYPVSRDAVDSPVLRLHAARALLMIGDTDAALEVLEEITNKPYGPTGWSLAVDSEWAALHDHPRFKALMPQSNDTT